MLLIKNLVRVAFLIFTLLALLGCQTPVKTEVQIETKYIVIKPNPSELVDCDTVEPTDPFAFTSMTLQERVADLGTYAIRLQSALNKCDNKAALRKFYTDQEKLYESKK